MVSVCVCGVSLLRTVFICICVKRVTRVRVSVIDGENEMVSVFAHETVRCSTYTLLENRASLCRYVPQNK